MANSKKKRHQSPLGGLGCCLCLWLALCFPLGLGANELPSGTYLPMGGKVRVVGNTGLFSYTGTNQLVRGCLQLAGGSTTGSLYLKLSDFDFNRPFAQAVLEEKDYFDAVQYPYITLDLLSLDGTQAWVRVRIKDASDTVPVELILSPGPAPYSRLVTGTMRLKHSDFGILLKQIGPVQVEDVFNIEVELLFEPGPTLQCQPIDLKDPT